MAAAERPLAGRAWAQEPAGRGDNRPIVNGILWRIRTGAPWRDVPEKYGKWMTLYQRFRRWSEAGIWEAAATVLTQAMADNRASQHRFHNGPGPCLGRRRKRGTREQAFGRSRGGFTCKVHCLSDADGLPLGFHLTPGEAADCTAFETSPRSPKRGPVTCSPTKGTTAMPSAAASTRRVSGSCIPPRSNRKAPMRWNKRLYQRTQPHRTHDRSSEDQPRHRHPL